MNLSEFQNDAKAGEAVLARALEEARQRWGGRLVAAYALGSLAHGGFSEHVSDVDFAVILAEPLGEADRASVVALTEAVKASGLPLADRLSTFWGSEAALSRGEEGGRFPPVDRLDLAENGRLLAGREVRARVVRPSTEEMVIAAARQSLNMFARPESMAQLRDPSSLVAAGARSLTKRVLFPVRFLYTAQTGAIGRNDAAVEHFLRRATGSVASLARDAFLWRYTPFTPGDPAVFATARAGLLPLYRLFANDYQARLSVLEDRELARAFSAWRVALDAPAASLDAPVG